MAHPTFLHHPLHDTDEPDLPPSRADQASPPILTLACMSLCKHCRTEYVNPECGPDCCEECYTNLVEREIGGEEIWIEHPVTQYHEDLLYSMFITIKKEPAAFSFAWRPFSFASLLSFRLHLMSILPVDIPWPVQTKGKRNGLKKEWVMTLKETSVFNAVVGAAFPQSWVSFATGRLFVDNMMTAWVPPLTFIVTSTDPAGLRNSGCKLQMQSARITNYGFDFTKRTKIKDHLAIKEYLSVIAFKSQKDRVERNHQSALDHQLRCPALADSPPPPPPPKQAPMMNHGLLMAALPHAQRTAAPAPAAPAPSNPPQGSS